MSRSTKSAAAPDRTGRKQAGTRFAPGQSGNPTGRPKGARNRTSLAVEALLDGEAEALTRKAIDLALGGDMQALRICLERLCPPRKDRPISIELPKVETAADAVKANAAIMQAVAAGEITPAEGGEVMRLLEGFARTIEVAELEDRLTALEQQMHK